MGLGRRQGRERRVFSINCASGSLSEFFFPSEAEGVNGGKPSTLTCLELWGPEGTEKAEQRAHSSRLGVSSERAQGAAPATAPNPISTGEFEAPALGSATRLTRPRLPPEVAVNPPPRNSSGPPRPEPRPSPKGPRVHSAPRAPRPTRRSRSSGRGAPPTWGPQPGRHAQEEHFRRRMHFRSPGANEVTATGVPLAGVRSRVLSWMTPAGLRWRRGKPLTRNLSETVFAGSQGPFCLRHRAAQIGEGLWVSNTTIPKTRSFQVWARSLATSLFGSLCRTKNSVNLPLALGRGGFTLGEKKKT